MSLLLFHYTRLLCSITSLNSKIIIATWFLVAYVNQLRNNFSNSLLFFRGPMLKKLFTILVLPLTLITNVQSQDLTQSEIEEIATEAYIYFYPLISMEVTRQVTTNLPAGTKPGMGPMNAFHHMKKFPDAQFREVVRPNFDTLYSSAWLDLSKEPMIISAPDTKGRHYLLPMLDMWSDVFSSPGKRTSGTKEGKWAVIPPNWKGSLPNGVEKIQSPTSYVWIIGRTQTNGPKDYAAVSSVQEGYSITPLSKWGQKYEPKFVSNPNVDMKTPPLTQVNTMPAGKYFSLATELTKLNPPHLTDSTILMRLKRIGIEVGKSFDISKVSPTVKAALEKAPAEGLKALKAKLPTLAKVVNGWQMNTDTMGVYGNFYMKRAIVAMVGLGANLPEDAIYPLNISDADGDVLEGDNDYILHFSKEELPPVNAFWSLTMYDEEGFQVANKLNRFAIGDRDELKFNADGSLDIYIQHDSPGEDKESNWLPSPSSGKLGITLRLYGPKTQAIDGRWTPPAVEKN
jgi:hypothetical protein